jgi:hypothetical protein
MRAYRTTFKIKDNSQMINIPFHGFDFHILSEIGKYSGRAAEPYQVKIS